LKLVSKLFFNEKGKTDHPNRLRVNIAIGAIKKTVLFDFVGIKRFLVNNFKASAIG
jgi:hypothetical protein